MSDMTITAAVDGSSLSNPGPSGWAWVVDEEHWDAGGWPEGTNNLGELTAILELLKATEAAGLGDQTLTILADSQYAIHVITKWRHSWKKRGWTKADKKPIKNLEVIQHIDRIIEGRDVCFHWVKGHAGHALNEKADELARSCAEAYKEGRTPAPGPRFGAGVRGASPDSSSLSTQVQTVPHTAQSSQATPVLLPASPNTDSSSFQTCASHRVRELEKRVIQAWVAGDTDTLDTLCASECVRVWPDGTRTFGARGFLGPVPPSLSVSRYEVREVGNTFLVSYTLTWELGQAAELSVWVHEGEDTIDTTDTAKNLVLVHHHSTPIVVRDSSPADSA